MLTGIFVAHSSDAGTGLFTNLKLAIAEDKNTGFSTMSSYKFF